MGHDLSPEALEAREEPPPLKSHERYKCLSRYTSASILENFLCTYTPDPAEIGMSDFFFARQQQLYTNFSRNVTSVPVSLSTLLCHPPRSTSMEAANQRFSGILSQ